MITAISNPSTNVSVGVLLLSRIEARLASPTVEGVATTYNNLAATQVSDYGARVWAIYREKPWLAQ